MARRRMGHGHTPTTLAMLALSRTRRMRTALAPPRRCRPTRAGQSTTLSYHGCLGKSSRALTLLILSCQHCTNFCHSACTCPGEDHPGPDVSKGRGAPEIDVLEAQKNKLGAGAKVSQSAQFAPFSHDYFYDNTTQDVWWIYNETATQANSYL